MAKDNPETHSLGSAANAALGAAGEAAAFIAGAPISGAAEAAIELGEVVAGREAQLEQAIIGRHGTDRTGTDRPGPRAASGWRSQWAWLAIGFVAAAICLALVLR